MTGLRAPAGAEMPKAIADAKSVRDREALESRFKIRPVDFALAAPAGCAEGDCACEVADRGFKNILRRDGRCKWLADVLRRDWVPNEMIRAASCELPDRARALPRFCAQRFANNTS